MAYIEAENLQKTFKVYERPKGAGGSPSVADPQNLYRETGSGWNFIFHTKRGNGGIYRAKRGREIHYD